MKNPIRVRFAPSPTGPLHIGGVRTALYNYLFAKKYNGSFILRIEDTDHARYTKGAEEYIRDSLMWLNLVPDESPWHYGEYGPYRQSERLNIYKEYIKKLIDSGHAYYAFDSPQEIEQMRERERGAGKHSPKYDHSVRLQMNNSLTISEAETRKRRQTGKNITVRLKIPPEEIISFKDIIRGDISFRTEELDDKVIMKADGFPTYHLANVVDDHLMKISHVIRGEEWLSSTAHHVLLYRSFDWEDQMPEFAHLPLILKPTGKGKLSKRDGAKFGFPVFPLEWKTDEPDEVYEGFKENGFLPEAVINFLALLGWNPGTDDEILSLDELVSLFSPDKIHKSGAQFNYEKAKWFNHNYIAKKTNEEILHILEEHYELKEKVKYSSSFMLRIIELLKPRVETLFDFYVNNEYFFKSPSHYDEKAVRKKSSAESKTIFTMLKSRISQISDWSKSSLEYEVKGFITENNLKFGEVFSILRIFIAGSLTGPDLFSMIEILGKKETVNRIENGLIFLSKIE